MIAKRQVRLNSDMEVMWQLLQEAGFEPERIRRMDGSAIRIQVNEQEVHVGYGYDHILATGDIPGFPMKLFGHGDFRFIVNI